MNKYGLKRSEVEGRRARFGTNALTQKPPDPLWKKILSGFGDPMILILLVALVVQVVLFFSGQAEWFEPAGIFAAVLIANGVASISEYSQESKASALKAEAESKETAKVIRDGQLSEIHVSGIVVGDLVCLQAGDKIPADGEIVEGRVKVDQSVLNGETEEAEKTPAEDPLPYDVRDLLNRHYVYRGTTVCSGEARMTVREVGDKTFFGELALEVQEGIRKTPLQLKLGKLAGHISTFGYAGAIAIVAGILIRTVASGAVPSGIYGWIRLIMDAVTIAVTIIVCAVPEGLPMLTSILLSLQSLKMAKDNVLVRKINGLETAGSLNILFSDKTGTITEGHLSVVEVITGNMEKYTTPDSIPAALAPDIITGTGLNNSASVSGDSVIGGNSTDRALMLFLMAAGAEKQIDRSRLLSFEPFDSAKKYSLATVQGNAETEIYVKGAPENIIARCTRFTNGYGKTEIFTKKQDILEYLDLQGMRSMRLLAVAKRKETDAENDWTLICVFCIRDNVRKEIAHAVNEVRDAGIQVVMVTGDRKETAAAIARDAGILTSPSDIVLTSAEMAEKNDEELKELLPRLRVVARALPSDKSRLVRVAQELDLVVGMTGDGVNDSPALKKADVGFAMGSGTEVAKEAGDIIILDDNFASIEKAILYGRTMFKSIRKFLVFQLTVNVAAVLVCFLGPMLGENVVLTVIQLLLINLAMDTLAAIAFGSEPALQEYMKEKPVPRTAGIISGKMFAEILTGAIYIALVCLGILFFAPIRSLFCSASPVVLRSALFAVFMMSITFNGFSARTSHLNPFAGLGKNRNFILVMVLILALQFLFITFGGHVLNVESLPCRLWGICLLLSLMILPVGIVRKLISRI